MTNIAARELHRLPNWRDRFEAAVYAAMRRPFDERTWNCAHFAAAIVVALCGDEHAADLEQLASSRELWEQARASPEAFASLVTDALGTASAIKNVGLANVGDLVLAQVGDADLPVCFGVCMGAKIAVVAGGGLLLHPRLGIGTDKLRPPRRRRREGPFLLNAWRVG